MSMNCGKDFVILPSFSRRAILAKHPLITWSTPMVLEWKRRKDIELYACIVNKTWNLVLVVWENTKMKFTSVLTCIVMNCLADRESLQIRFPDHTLMIFSGVNECKMKVYILQKKWRKEKHEGKRERGMQSKAKSDLLNIHYSLTSCRYFEILILLTIFVNCVFLALTNPPEEPE